MMLRNLLAAAVLALGAMPSMAATVDLTYNGGTAGGTVRFDASPVAPAHNPAGAWGFKMSSPQLGDIVAWCLDIGAPLGQSGSHAYQTTTTPFSNSTSLSDAQRKLMGNLFSANYSTLDAANRDQAASFQAALWEIVYENSGTFSLANGALQVTGLSGTNLTLAATYLANAQAYTGKALYNLTFLQSTANPHKQNLVTVSEVPLPAGAILLLTAAGGLVALRRRKAA